MVHGPFPVHDQNIIVIPSSTKSPTVFDLPLQKIVQDSFPRNDKLSGFQQIKSFFSSSRHPKLVLFFLSQKPWNSFVESFRSFMRMTSASEY